MDRAGRHHGPRPALPGCHCKRLEGARKLRGISVPRECCNAPCLVSDQTASGSISSQPASRWVSLQLSAGIFPLAPSTLGVLGGGQELDSLRSNMALIGEMVSPIGRGSSRLTSKVLCLDQEFAPIMRRANPDWQARTVPDQHLTPNNYHQPECRKRRQNAQLGTARFGDVETNRPVRDKRRQEWTPSRHCKLSAIRVTLVVCQPRRGWWVR